MDREAPRDLGYATFLSGDVPSLVLGVGGAVSNAVARALVNRVEIAASIDEGPPRADIGRCLLQTSHDLCRQW
jgi:hypothetical protein